MNIQKIIASIVGLLIIGVGAYFLFLKTDRTSAELISEMQKKMVDITSASFTANIKVDGDLADVELPVSVGQGEVQSAQINLSGTFDSTDLQNPIGMFNATMQAGEIDNIGFDAILNGEQIYLKVNTLPSVFPLNPALFTNQWIFIDQAELEKEFSLKTDELGDNVEVRKELTEEQIKQIQEAVQNAKLIIITDELGAKEISGVDTVGYEFEIDTVELVRLIEQISEIVDEEITASDQKDIDEAVMTAEEFDGQMWIGKTDNLLYNVSGSVFVEDDETGKSGTVTFDVTMSDYNQPVEITIPEQTKSIEELMQEVLGGIFGGIEFGGDFGGLQPEVNYELGI